MRKYLLPKEGNFYRANLHAHTNMSDGSASPELVKEVFKRMGYSIVAYTDHDIMLDRSHLNDEEFLALNGYEMEINGKGTPDWANMETCHICLIALEPDNLKQVCWHRSDYLYAHAVEYRDQIQFYEDEPDYIREYTGECISDMMKRGREHGFFVTYNHPTGSLENYTHYINYHNMHAMEMYNGAEEYNPRVYDDMLRAGERIYCIGGDDNHNRPTLYSDAGKAWTMIKANSLDYRSITKALMDGNFYATQGPEIYEMYIEDGVLHVVTSDVVKILFTPGNRRATVSYPEEGKTVMTTASYKLFDDNIYIRVTVVDERGRTANTNAYFIDEIKCW
ncbi:MAG: PHP domain-containing protein [Lachnospiraceae bacterium]|nr:PHP domain-containing protein [Lachnospiraceae bacterium]